MPPAFSPTEFLRRLRSAETLTSFRRVAGLLALGSRDRHPLGAGAGLLAEDAMTDCDRAFKIAYALWAAHVELNTIRARDGVPYMYDGTRSSVPRPGLGSASEGPL